MKNMLLCGAAALALVACGELTGGADNAGDATKHPKPQRLLRQNLAYLASKPKILIRKSTPATTFYQYAGGKWIDTFRNS